MNRINKSKKPKSLKSIKQQSLSAGIVWIALNDLAASKNNNVITPTRALLKENTGLSETTISKALTCLHNNGWIVRVLTTKVNRNGTGIVTLLLITLKRKSPRISGNNKSSKNGCQRNGKTANGHAANESPAKSANTTAQQAELKDSPASINAKKCPQVGGKKTVLDSPSERGEGLAAPTPRTRRLGASSPSLRAQGLKMRLGETVSLNDEVDFSRQCIGPAELPVPEAASNNSMPDVGDKENCETPNRATDDSSYPCSNQQKERGGE
ncbi:MAG: hypothetical protein KDA54_00220 [Phycisphaerales bacterium]|nr:hypothetical protein [Phycisphaerales bacterium]